MTLKHAVVMGAVAGLTAVLVLLVVWLIVFLSVRGTSEHHGVVQLGPDGRPTYTVP